MTIKNEMTKAFINALNATANFETVTAEFRNGEQVVYTKQMFGLLATDKNIIEIVDNQTGEILYEA